MTQTQYGAKVTELIDARIFEFEYPKSFDADVESCFLRRMTPLDAAKKLIKEYTGQDTDDE